MCQIVTESFAMTINRVNGQQLMRCVVRRIAERYSLVVLVQKDTSDSLTMVQINPNPRNGSDIIVTATDNDISTGIGKGILYTVKVQVNAVQSRLYFKLQRRKRKQASLPLGDCNDL